MQTENSVEVCLSAKMDWNAEAHTCVNDFNSGPDKVHFERPGSCRIHGGGGGGEELILMFLVWDV